MMENYYLLLVGMALVTFIPRILPLLFLRNLALTPKLQEFLGYIPYAALGALIIPGVFEATGNPYYGLIGALVAGILAYFNINLLLVVIGAITSVFLLQVLF